MDAEPDPKELLSAYGRWRAKQKQPQSLVCAVCGTSYDDKRKRGPVNYCSAACRVKAYEQRTGTNANARRKRQAAAPQKPPADE